MAMLTPAQKPRGLARMIFICRSSLSFIVARRVMRRHRRIVFVLYLLACAGDFVAARAAFHFSTAAVGLRERLRRGRRSRLVGGGFGGRGLCRRRRRFHLLRRGGRRRDRVRGRLLRRCKRGCRALCGGGQVRRLLLCLRLLGSDLGGKFVRPGRRHASAASPGALSEASFTLADASANACASTVFARTIGLRRWSL